MSSEADQHHDVFISYAREDTDWVRKNLYEPLLGCRTSKGRPPRIFFDIGEHGIRIGQNFMEVIAGALQNASRIVPVYSQVYFTKEMTRYELELAHSRDVSGRKNVLLPILREPEAASQIPYAVHLINYWPCTDPDWFKKLATALGFEAEREPISLSFIDQPGDVFVNHTLPVVRVAVRAGDAPITYEEEITIRAENAALQGTTTRRTEQGVATFDDLSIGQEIESTHLLAGSASMEQVVGESFSVFDRPNRTSSVAAEIRLPGVGKGGRIEFFGHGRAFAVIRGREIEAYRTDGQPLLSQPLSLRAPVRIVRRNDTRLVFADWSGQVLLLDDDATHHHWDLSANESFPASHGQPEEAAGGGFAVPADVVLGEEDLYIGFWNGSVYRLQTGQDPTLILRDNDGVQAMGVFGERLFCCDFAGNLRVYRGGRLINNNRLEPTIWLLKRVASGLLAVGERRFYHISSDGGRVIDFEMPLSGVSSVLELSALPVAIDLSGKGIRFDSDLIISHTFYTVPGAEPIGADNAGVYGVLRNPDDSCTLLVRDRIVFSQPDGVLAVSSNGETFVVGSQREIQLFTKSAFETIIQKS